MIDENYLAKKAIFETLREKGLFKSQKSYEEHDESFYPEETRAEKRHKRDYLEFKNRMSKEELADFNFVFDE